MLVGLRYLTLPASRVWMAGLVMAMAVIADGISRDHSRLTSRLASWGPVLLVLTICLAQLGLTVASGGDWMPDARFISHVTPLIAVLMVTSIPYLRQLLAEWPKRMVRVLAMGAVVYFVASNVTSTRDARKYVEMLAASEQRALYGMADYLNHHATADDAVACSDVGRVSYYFHGRVIDWWGLADEEIARTHQSIGHLRPETILSRRPRFIVLYSTRPTLDATSMESNMAVYSRPFWASPEFHRSYRHVLSLFFWPDRYHVLFERAEPRSD